DFLGRDIRMVGYNPDYESACAWGSKIITAEDNKMVFNACNLDKKGSDYKDYKITIEFKKDEKELHLTRDEDMNGASSMPIAYGVDDFLIKYLNKNLATTSSLKEIRYVQIAILVRSTYPDQKYTDSIQHTLDIGHTWGPANDNYHRRLLITTIQLRNMAVQQ
ncbi:PilW family protein, partial [Desulfobulbus sp. F5]|nr:PilW family protein [Desulfobulbus sp. F5]